MIGVGPVSIRALRYLAKHRHGGDGIDAGSLGAHLWPEGRKGRIASVNGGGDYAAQNLLGRLRKLGLTRPEYGPGSTRWTVTYSALDLLAAMEKS